MVLSITSLGLFILDTFEFRLADGSVTSIQDKVIGGGGTYFILGSRIWLPATDLGIVVDRGFDWESEVQAKLDAFGKEMWVYRDKKEETTRALNLYTGENRQFKYLNDRSKLEPSDLPPSLLSSHYLHFICSPTRALTIISQLSPNSSFNPKLCYEPIPDKCVPEELAELVKVLARIEVLSPNHEEALSLLGRSAEYTDDGTLTVEERKAIIESAANTFLDLGAGGLVVIRSGALGSYSRRNLGNGIRGEGFWVDAFHTDKTMVKDVTGAGNSFLGGILAGLIKHPDDDLLASQMASVSASFFIEQYGLPALKSSNGAELWNGFDPSSRLDDLVRRSGK